MTPRRTATADPWVVSVVILVVATVTGLVAIAFGWRGVAARVDVADQMPYVVSGVMGGIALLGLALGVLVIQSRRRAEAHRRVEVEYLITAVSGLAAAVRARRGD